MIEFDHRRHVEDFWSRSDVQLDGAPDLQQAVRFNLFELMQATARGEGLGVPAKGLTGLEGDQGHYFWDTEIYVVPFLGRHEPAMGQAGAALSLRDARRCARTRARETGHHGALYPWRTIGGEEASAWYAAGTAQYHINADIAYALRQYGFVTVTWRSCSATERRCSSRPLACGWSSASSPTASAGASSSTA